MFNRNELKKHLYSYAVPYQFTLLNLCFISDSLLQFSHKEGDEILISGINVPWFYYGIMFSTFCWHTEDMFLYSVNYMHEGKPKVWYSISSEDKEKFDEYVKKKYYAKILKDPLFLFNLSTHISPLELIEQGIQVYKTIQYPGELVVTLPKGYHMGFSAGYNKNEAVNFAVSYILNN